MRFHLGVFFVCHRRIRGRNAVVGGTLKHGQVLGFFGNDGRHLHARGTSANDGHALARISHFMLGPDTAVDHLAFEAL